MMKSVTLTCIINATSNYGESLGNVSSTHKVYKNGKEYAIRSRESLKNAICVQSGLYDDLQTSNDGVMQKLVTKDENAATCKALEGGYMSTSKKEDGGLTYIRNSSFYLTDAVAVESFINDTRFHNNLYLAANFAKANGLNVQNDAVKVGLMPYQYEFDKSMKIYSITIDLEKIGVDDNFNAEASNEEKYNRVSSILDAVENLSLIVKGNLDNAEPIFVVGGMSPRKTHIFENSVAVNNGRLSIEPIKEKMSDIYSCAIIANNQLKNQDDIIRELNPDTIHNFFNNLKLQVRTYYGI